MTTQTETTKEKQVPAFYLFETVEVNGKEERKIIGSAFPHKKGNGLTLLINGKRYSAFPPKPKTAAAPATAEAATAQPEATGEKGA